MTKEEKEEAYLEFKILQKLDHPFIVKFMDVFLTKKPKLSMHIVMEYADGGDLQSKIRSQKGTCFSENQVLDWFTQICLALKHIHDRKILHRDIKSQNIFLTKSGMTKLGDFGIAKCLNETKAKAQTVIGTPYYLSPEIIQNKPYSFGSDVWSLGILLYEMCALKVPFDAHSLPQLYLKIIKGQYNPVPTNFSKEVRQLIQSMLSIDAAKRPTIKQILQKEIIIRRTKAFLSEFEYDKEFSHTILHDYVVD